MLIKKNFLIIILSLNSYGKDDLPQMTVETPATVKQYEENKQSLQVIQKTWLECKKKFNKFLAIDDTREALLEANEEYAEWGYFYMFDFDLPIFQNNFEALLAFVQELNEKKILDRATKAIPVLEDLILQYIFIVKNWAGGYSTCAIKVLASPGRLLEFPVEIYWALSILNAFFPGESLNKKLTALVNMVKANFARNSAEIQRLEEEIGISDIERKYYDSFHYIKEIIYGNVVFDKLKIEDF